MSDEKLKAAVKLLSELRIERDAIRTVLDALSALREELEEQRAVSKQWSTAANEAAAALRQEYEASRALREENENWHTLWLRRGQELGQASEREERLRAALEEIAKLHVEDRAPDEGWCKQCDHGWPCATIRAARAALAPIPAEPDHEYAVEPMNRKPALPVDDADRTHGYLRDFPDGPPDPTPSGVDRALSTVGVPQDGSGPALPAAAPEPLPLGHEFQIDFMTVYRGPRTLCCECKEPESAHRPANKGE